jgi:hypothetical protein
MLCYLILTGLDVAGFNEAAKRFLVVAATAYWQARKEILQVLSVLDPLVRPIVQRNQPTVYIESGLCEILRRRSAALVWCRIRTSQLKFLP